MSTERELAIISVFDKVGIVELADFLQNKCNLELVSTGGTAAALRAHNLHVTDVSEITGVAEMLNGRVKTLHPAIHGGILARRTSEHEEDMNRNHYRYVRVVVCNLYPFEETVAKEDCIVSEAVEQIDIGGVTLLRAAAKNHERVTVISNPADYAQVIAEMHAHNGHTSLDMRKMLALKAFAHTAHYDAAITEYMRREFAGAGSSEQQQLSLRYGMNPHQKPAELSISLMEPHARRMPIRIINGSPGYINLLDGLNGWQLVKELSAAMRMPAAASFKHVSPAGAAIGLPLTQEEAQAYMVDDMPGVTLSKFNQCQLAVAYARARGADRMSSFGDFIALSHPCDELTAKVISREVSDGIIAPGYEAKALDLLIKKKQGNYVVIEMDPNWAPVTDEERTVYGLKLKQRRNDATITEETFKNVVTVNKRIPDSAIRDMIVATIALKYAQSNSVVYAYRGQVIGVGAGQQSRLHCTRLAGEKSANWWSRLYPKLLGLPFNKEVKRAERANAIDSIINGEMEETQWAKLMSKDVPIVTKEQLAQWRAELSEVVLSSDAFFPFRDNIDCAHRFGVKYVVSPGGSSNDDSIIRACNEHGMCLVHTGLRLFHH